MIVVADGDVIRNDVEYKGSSAGIVPLGFDRVTKQMFGNRNFIVNSLLYLTDDENWLELRNRTIKLRLINQAVTTSYRTYWQVFNVLVPLLFLATFGGIYFLVRRRRNRGLKFSSYSPEVFSICTTKKREIQLTSPFLFERNTDLVFH